MTDSCGTLVLSDWRQNYLDSYTGPQPAAPAVVGLVVGTALATLFFTLDRGLRQRGQRNNFGRMPVSVSLYQKLSSGKLAVVISRIVAETPVVVGMIPAMTKHVCAQQMDHVVGENDGMWSAEAAPFKEIFALQGDRLVFIYKDNVTVFSMASKEDYTMCSFANATLFKPFTEDAKTGEKHVVVQLNSLGMQFFAAENYCNDTPPLKLAVSVAVPSALPGSGKMTDSCGTLVLSDWRQNYLDSYTGPQPAAPAVVGLVVGTALATLFFTLDRGLRQRGQTAASGNRFQRF